MNDRIKYLFILIVFLFSFRDAKSKLLSINADISLKFEKLSVEHGLSQSNVNAILQDSKGFLWFGTDEGLNKYDGYSFVVFKNDPSDSNSISNDIISSLYEDSTGTLWIGTYGGGLNKYDSRSNKFVRYEFEDDNPYCLSCNYVTTIYEDKGNTIWVGTVTGGLNKYDSEKNGFLKFKEDSSESNEIKNNNIKSIFEDSYGIFWVGTDLGLFTINKSTGKFSRITKHELYPADPLYNVVKTIFEDEYGTLWFGFGVKGLNRFNRDDGTFTSFLLDKEDPGSFTYNDVVKIIGDKSGNLWIATDGGGLYVFNRDSRTFTGYQNLPNDPHSLSNNYLRYIYQDRNKILWIGTWGGGINKAVRKRQNFNLYQHDPYNKNSLCHNRILRLLTDKDGYIWIGTDGGGLDRFDISTETFRNFRYSPKNKTGMSNNYVSALFEDGYGNIWIGTWGGGLNKINRQTGKIKQFGYSDKSKYNTSGEIITSIEQDNNGNLYIGTYGSGLNIISSEEIKSDRPIFEKIYADTTNPFSLPSNYISKILKDSEGNLWLATPKTGLVNYNTKKKSFITFINNPNDSTSISSNTILSIYEPENDKDILWIGTLRGLNKMTKGYKDEPPTFGLYTKDSGMVSNKVFSILEDDDDNLWLGTDKGISKFNPYSETFNNFDTRDGLQGDEFSLNAVCKGPDGELFFGGINGLNVFTPTKIQAIEGLPPVVLTDLKLFNESILPGNGSPLQSHINSAERITFQYSQDAFSIEFASLDFTEPFRNQYAYKLEGFNDDWIYTSSNKRFASYTYLPTGEYIFRVKASNSDGIWNEEGTSVIIEVVPPFWQRIWFLLVSAAVIGVLVFISIKRRFHSVRMKIELQAAHDAQMSIMPQEDPKLKIIDVSGMCLPANEVGGDFFDYIWLDKEQTNFGIAVGDVSGKAMRSAMTAVLTSGMISSLVQDADSVDKIMTKINFPIYQKTDKKMFIALCLASIDLNKRKFTFTNAGLMQPLHKSNGTINVLESEGPKFPLGALSNTVYDKRTVDLNEGDVIVIYSDGITDAQNSDKEFYGSDRILNFFNELNIKSLTAKEIKNKIIANIHNFTRNASQHDDMTLVVIKVNDYNKNEQVPN